MSKLPVVLEIVLLGVLVPCAASAQSTASAASPTSASGPASTATPTAKPKRIGGTLGKILDGIGHWASSADSAANVSNAVGGASAPSPGSSHVIAVTAPQIIGTDTITPKFHVDSGITRTPTATRCGVARVCGSGWDLRLVSVAVPQSKLPEGERVPLTVVIENRGRAASPASEVALCVAAGNDCGKRLRVEALPPLASGERLRLVSYVLTQDLTWEYAAVIDPDHATGEVNRSNNSARTGDLTTQIAVPQILVYDVDQHVAADRTVRVHIQIRNASFAQSTPATELLWSRPGVWSWRTPIPAIGPRQTFDATYRVDVHHYPGMIGIDSGTDFLVVHFDPDEPFRFNRDGAQPVSDAREFRY